MTHRILLFLGLTLAVRAQNISGSIVGTVRDSTGAVIAAARVTVTNEETSVPFQAQTNAAGDYVAPNLPPGCERWRGPCRRPPPRDSRSGA